MYLQAIFSYALVAICLLVTQATSSADVQDVRTSICSVTIGIEAESQTAAGSIECSGAGVIVHQPQDAAGWLLASGNGESSPTNNGQGRGEIASLRTIHGSWITVMIRITAEACSNIT